MKIQCDGCTHGVASVFCTADEAALCDDCDRRVHHANKLAGKHLRFSLLHPSMKGSPRCDICQERRAFVFCQEDRAILCCECDEAIHKANEHTQKHSRFLLTGVKLSTSSSPYNSSSSSSSTSACDAASDKTSRGSTAKPDSVSTEIFKNMTSTQKKSQSTTDKVNENQNREVGPVSTSSISEYLMETLPGWRVDDFLDPSPAPSGFCKTQDGLWRFVDPAIESNLGSFSSEDLAIWVPQIPPTWSHPPLYLPHNDALNGFNELEEAISKKASRKWSDDCFTVPQLSFPSVKKSRPFW